MIGPVPSRIYDYRYTYTEKLYAAYGSIHGLLCNPVRRDDGKCIRGRSMNQLVEFEDGERCVVVGRRLRVNKKQLEFDYAKNEH